MVARSALVLQRYVERRKRWNMALFRQPTARTALPGDAVETVSPDAPTLAPVAHGFMFPMIAC